MIIIAPSKQLPLFKLLNHMVFEPHRFLRPKMILLLFLFNEWEEKLEKV